MGLYLAKLPPAELARLKAELAETLIENFCYPRFLDYRVNALRMRPVDRSKRQEVWSFLSSYDFASWGRVDVQSSEFQRLVERLLIQYIQRNRAFFGNQGRKRMSDVRTLIGSSSTVVTEGLRTHLAGRRSEQSAQHFGSPRPVVSWSGSIVATDLVWEQIAGSTQLLQQQMQMVREEIHVESENEAHAFPASPPRSAATTIVQPKRSPRNRASSNGSGKVNAAPSVKRETDVPSTPNLESTPIPQVKEIETAPTSDRNSQEALTKHEAFLRQATDPALAIEVSPPQAPTTATMRELSRVPTVSQPLLPVMTHVPGELTTSTQGASVILSDEDIVIFEQLKYQLVVWLRVEAVRLGLEITNQSPLQLIDLLFHHEDFDEARLQVVTTLLQLIDSVIAKGRAELIDYKQAMMFFLMHTRRIR